MTGRSNQRLIFDRASPTHMSVEQHPIPTIDDGQVLIQVVAVGLNRADLKKRAGKHAASSGVSDPAIFGMEIAGIVIQVGAQVKRWAVGDEVVALVGFGGFSNFIAVDAGLILPKPKSVSLEDAAAIPEVAATLWSSFGPRAFYSPQQSVLVHGGTSGLGLHATQVIVAFGHHVSTTCGTDKKVQASLEAGARASVNYRNSDFVKDFTAMGIEFDLIIDPIGGAYINRDISVLKRGGHISSLGAFDDSECTIDLRTMALRQCSLSATSLGARTLEEKTQLMGQVEINIWPFVESGRVSPNVSSRYRFAEVFEAMRALESGTTMGKIIIQM